MSVSFSGFRSKNSPIAGAPDTASPAPLLVPGTNALSCAWHHQLLVVSPRHRVRRGRALSVPGTETLFARRLSKQFQEPLAVAIRPVDVHSVDATICDVVPASLRKRAVWTGHDSTSLRLQIRGKYGCGRGESGPRTTVLPRPLTVSVLAGMRAGLLFGAWHQKGGLVPGTESRVGGCL